METVFLGLSRQVRVVIALTMREVRLRNSKFAFHQLFDLLEALAFIVGHWIIFTFLHRQLLIGDSLLLFITTGILPVLYFRTISIRAAGGIEASKSVTNIPTVEALDYSLARVTVEVLSYIMLFAAFFAGIYAFGLSRLAIPFNPLAVVQSVALLTLFSFGIGIANSFLIYVFPLYKMFWGAFSRVQIFCSAVFFIPEYMPPAIKEIISWNPMMHFVALFRMGFYSTYPTHLFSMSYAVICTICMVVIGLMLERVLRSHRHG
jgi:capsular polysaccharide transport system permease protein